MEHKAAHVVKMERRLKKWGARLDALVAKGDGVGVEARDDYKNRIDDVQWQYGLMRTRLDELKDSSGGEWLYFKSGVENAWNRLEAAFEKMAN